MNWWFCSKWLINRQLSSPSVFWPFFFFFFFWKGKQRYWFISSTSSASMVWDIDSCRVLKINHFHVLRSSAVRATRDFAFAFACSVETSQWVPLSAITRILGLLPRSKGMCLSLPHTCEQPIHGWKEPPVIEWLCCKKERRPTRKVRQQYWWQDCRKCQAIMWLRGHDVAQGSIVLSESRWTFWSHLHKTSWMLDIQT